MGDDLLSVKTLFQTLWKWSWVILLVVVVLTGTVVGISLVQTPQYEATIKVLVGQDRGISQTPQDAFALQGLATTMATAINSQRTADGVIEELDLQTTPDQVLANLEAEPVPETQFIEVTYTDTDPQRAAEIVNTVGSVFSTQIAEVTEGNAITAVVWERALVQDSPVSPNPLQNGLLALAFGLALGVALALLLEYLDDRWQSPEEAEQVSGVPTYGVIPEFEPPRGKGKASATSEFDDAI